MKPADLERLARMAEHATGAKPDLGREILIAVAGWRHEGSALFNRDGMRMCLASDGDPTPMDEDDPTASIDACRRISPAELVAATERTVELADGSKGAARTLALAYAAAVCRAMKGKL